MKRFHVHVATADLEASIHFYSALFGVAPTVVKSDYAKWMLDDPRINFAVSARGAHPGINHLGIQVESETELEAQRKQVATADISAIDEAATACCYAKSDKYWVEDPQGIAWETFRTLESIPVFGKETSSTQACCVPAATLPISFAPRSLAGDPAALSIDRTSKRS